MRRVSKKRSVLNAERKQLRDALVAEGAPCEARFIGCTGLGTDWNEVKTRARRGSITDPANRTWMCRTDHRFITEHPDWALRHGWVLSSWSTPEDAEIAWRLRTTLRCPVSCGVDHRELVSVT